MAKEASGTGRKAGPQGETSRGTNMSSAHTYTYTQSSQKSEFRVDSIFCSQMPMPCHSYPVLPPHTLRLLDSCMDNGQCGGHQHDGKLN